MSRDEKLLIPVAVIIALMLYTCLIIACLKYDSYINELEEKANKYEVLVNKVGDIE